MEAFCAVPIKIASTFSLQNPKLQDSVYIDGKEICAVNYFGGEAEIVPVDWVRVYGSAMLVQKTYKRFSVGAEVRLWRYFSLSANWHKQDSGIYSNWGSYDDFSIALNVLFGAKQSSFSPAHKLAVTPRYPILAEKGKGARPEPEQNWATFKIRYRRVLPVVSPRWPDPNRFLIMLPSGGGKNVPLFQVGENEWQGEVTLECSKGLYHIWVGDYKVVERWGQATAREISMRIKGSGSDWVVLKCIEPQPGAIGEWAKFRATKQGPQNPC